MPDRVERLTSLLQFDPLRYGLAPFEDLIGECGAALLTMLLTTLLTMLSTTLLTTPTILLTALISLHMSAYFIGTCVY